MKNVVFWDLALCRSCVDRRFGGMYRLHLQVIQKSASGEPASAGCAGSLKKPPEHDARATRLRRSIHVHHFLPRSYWVNTRLVALDFFPTPDPYSATFRQPSATCLLTINTDPSPLLSVYLLCSVHSVRVTLQLTVSQSVCLGVEPLLGIMTR
jgi:hypothetical protein